ncbi:hypothetical protein PAMA_005860 [Pampus argenteus]
MCMRRDCQFKSIFAVLVLAGAVAIIHGQGGLHIHCVNKAAQGLYFGRADCMDPTPQSLISHAYTKQESQGRQDHKGKAYSKGQDTKTCDPAACSHTRETDPLQEPSVSRTRLSIILAAALNLVLLQTASGSSEQLYMYVSVMRALETCLVALKSQPQGLMGINESSPEDQPMPILEGYTKFLKWHQPLLLRTLLMACIIALNHKQNGIPLRILLQHQQYAKPVRMSDKQLDNLQFLQTNVAPSMWTSVRWSVRHITAPQINRAGYEKDGINKSQHNRSQRCSKYKYKHQYWVTARFQGKMTRLPDVWALKLQQISTVLWRGCRVGHTWSEFTLTGANCTRQHRAQYQRCTICQTIKVQTNGAAGQVRTKAQGKLYCVLTRDLNRHTDGIRFSENARKLFSKEGDSAGENSRRVAHQNCSDNTLVKMAYYSTSIPDWSPSSTIGLNWLAIGCDFLTADGDRITVQSKPLRTYYEVKSLLMFTVTKAFKDLQRWGPSIHQISQSNLCPRESNGISKKTLDPDRDLFTHSSTQDTESEGHLVTTASPLNSPNHRPVLKGLLLHEHLLTRDFQGDQHFFRRDGSVAAYPTMPGSLSASDAEDPVTQLVPHEDVPAFSDVATTATAAATSPLTTFSPTTPRPSVFFPEKKSSKDKTTGVDKVEPTTDSLTTQVTPNNRGSVTESNPAASSSSQRNWPRSAFPVEATLAPSSVRTKKGEARETILKNSQVGGTTMTSTTVITTTTTITTMQTSGMFSLTFKDEAPDEQYQKRKSAAVVRGLQGHEDPESCSLNFTDPVGTIEILQQSDSGVECNYLVTVYLGYGIEVQLLRVFAGLVWVDGDRQAANCWGEWVDEGGTRDEVCLRLNVCLAVPVNSRRYRHDFEFPALPTSSPEPNTGRDVTRDVTEPALTVLNVSVLEGERVTVEDTGGREPFILANESVLMRGLVLRSWSNQISIRFRSDQQHNSGFLLLHYQAITLRVRYGVQPIRDISICHFVFAPDHTSDVNYCTSANICILYVSAFVLSCAFPKEPAGGEVSVTHLHAGGEAYFHCLTGYRLQGPKMLTCRNATTPYWSGKEPRCVASCGGMIKNATYGRIVSPGFPGNYSNNLTCHWVLEAPEGHRLHIHFEKETAIALHFSSVTLIHMAAVITKLLQPPPERLLIKNGNNIDSPPVYDSYEVEYLPNEGVLSTGRYLFVEFTTDGTMTSTGAAIRYEGKFGYAEFAYIKVYTCHSHAMPMCLLSSAFAKGMCYEPFVKYGNFSSSDSTYSVGAVVEFSCDPGYTLEQGSVVIECMDAQNPQWNETEPACRVFPHTRLADLSLPLSLLAVWSLWPHSEIEKLSVTMHVSEPGVSVYVAAVCSGEITDSAGVVLSPNWPEAYDKGQDCIWGIHVEEDKRIMLDIQMLHVGKNDLLTFYDGDDLTANILGQYSGTRPHFKLYTSMADVTIQFQSDPATNIYGYNNGFVVHFFEVPRNDTCSELPEITNGWKSTSHPDLIHGTVITYQCYPGYELVGSEILMCQWDLSWSGDVPRCGEVMTCQDPGNVEHSRKVITGSRFAVGSTVQFICNKGYILSGSSLLTCYNRDSATPKWSERLPKCVPEKYEPCRNPGAASTSVQSSEKAFYQAGETLTFSCHSGYELQGEATIYCIPGHPSQWNSTPPACRASSAQYVDERSLDVVNMDYSMEGTNIALAVFIPTAIILVVVLGLYVYFAKLQGKSIRMPTSSLPYDNMTEESAFDNPVYESGHWQTHSRY